MPAEHVAQQGKAPYMYLEAIVALSLVFSYTVAGRQVDLTIQVGGLTEHKQRTCGQLGIRTRRAQQRD